MNLHCLTVAVLIFALFYSGYSEEECQNADENGNCSESCPAGTFEYTPGCENFTLSQKTCRQPEVKILGTYCDFVRCDCLEEKYWDEAAQKCVLFGDCSDQSKIDGN